MLKYNPGHYMQQKSAGTDDPGKLSFALSPGFRGVLVDIPWAALEPARGQYDLLTLRRYLAWGAEHDRQVIALIMDRDFRSGPGPVVPRWLAAEGLTVPFNAKQQNAGTMAALWLPRAAQYRIELLEAIAADLDNHPRLEAVALAETAPGGIAPGNTPGYRRAAYTDALVATIKAAGAAFTATQVWQSINWLGPADSDDLKRIAAAIEATGIGGLTNPDSVPWERGEKPMYEIMRSYAGRVAIAAGGDTSQLLDPASNPHYKSMGQLVQMQYQMGQWLGANYQLWNGLFASHQAGGPGNSTAYRRAIAELVADAGNGTIGERPTSWDGKAEPAERPVDREALRALLSEMDELGPQLTDWVKRARLAVG